MNFEDSEKEFKRMERRLHIQYHQLLRVVKMFNNQSIDVTTEDIVERIAKAEAKDK